MTHLDTVKTLWQQFSLVITTAQRDYFQMISKSFGLLAGSIIKDLMPFSK